MRKTSLFGSGRGRGETRVVSHGRPRASVFCLTAIHLLHQPLGPGAENSARLQTLGTCQSQRVKILSPCLSDLPELIQLVLGTVSGTNF